MFNRILLNKIEKSRKSILLLGPRQVGKSTLIKMLKPDLTINLASEDEFFQFQKNHRELESRLEATKKVKTLFVDEIQRIPRLLNSLQVIIDSNPHLKVYITGSSARKLRKGKANLLPGRIFTYQLTPLCISEISEILENWNNDFGMKFGFLPEVHTMTNDSDRMKLLRSYTNTYLKEEIMAESLVRGLDGFVRFLHEAAIQSGNFLDYSKLAKKARIPRQSTVRHFEILEDTLIATKVENDPDLDPERCDLVKHPRYFFFDIGVVNALRGSFSLSEDRIGRLWEHLIYNQLYNSITSHDLNANIYNFRTRGGLEVDFIYSCEGDKTAIECKSSKYIQADDYKNLLQLNKYYTNKKMQKMIIYRGNIEKKENGVWIVPIQKAFKILGFD